MKRVLDTQLDYRSDGLHYLQDAPFTGVAFALGREGAIAAEMEYLEGLRSGQTKEWYLTGAPMVESNFLLGALHGRAREWHRNGQLAEDGEYQYGITLWKKTWDERGNLESEVALKESDEAYEMLLKYRQLYAHR